ncbi:MAG: trypsin-like peptidase domain-containing protein [Planctomycetota bacterium]
MLYHRMPIAAASALLALASPALAQSNLAPSAAPPMDPAMRQKLDFARALSDVFERAATIIEPSVVHITSLKQERFRVGMMGRVRTRTVPSGLGSGVVLSNDGYVLTNNHVIEDAQTLRAQLADGRVYDAEVVGREPDVDLAVLKIDATDLTPARFSTEPVRVGEWVLAAGSPFGLSSTITAGIVSATGRTGLIRGRSNAYEDFIQTDAAVNPGNSGGPLINLEGEVVGINTAIFTRSGGSNGISFAIPADISRRVMDDLVTGGALSRGWLGVRFRPVQAADAERLGMRAPEGVYIAGVNPGGPADRSGLREGDVILELNGRTVDDESRFRTLIALATPGEGASALVRRGAEELTLDLLVSTRLDEVARESQGVAIPSLGVVLTTLDNDTSRAFAREFDLDQAQLTAVVYAENRAGELSRFKPGDIITGIQLQDETTLDSADPSTIRNYADADQLDRIYLVRGDARDGGVMRGYVPVGR